MMLIPSLLFSALTLATPDEGMWLFNHAPADELKQRYGFDVHPEWLEHLQRSCVRISTGGSGSIVSPDGLVMTNHHVGSDILEKLSTASKNLLELGFYAEKREDEVPCPDLHMDVLWKIEDVTGRVEAAGKGLGVAEAGAAQRKVITEITDEAKKATGLHCEVVTLYQGGRFNLYEYKRYTDVRLVFAPEAQIAFFGGDNDNFEFPRFDLDCCFFRIYEEGKPLAAKDYLRWSRDGSSDGDLVFVAGHPGSTQRLNTVAHLQYLRDVYVPTVLNRLMRGEVRLQVFARKSAENDRIAHTDLFSVQNSRKVYLGREAALLDPALFTEKAAEEAKLRTAVDANPEWKQEWGDAWDQIAGAETAAALMFKRYMAAGGSGMSLGTATFSIAKDILRLSEERKKPSSERLREYSDAALDALYEGLYSPAPLYPDFESMRLESGLDSMAETLGADDPMVLAVLNGKSPHDRAEECVRGTKLFDVAERKRLVQGGADAVAAAQDPMIELARALDPFSRRLRKRWEDDVQSPEREGYAKIASARFATEGEGVYPDATFTLRLSYGKVAGYTEDQDEVAPYTHIAGLYDEAEKRPKDAAYELPKSWTEARSAVASKTPLDFVCTADIIGGNSGSPVVNRACEVVGLIFDGNIQSLGGNYAYSDDQARAVSVDSRALLEALSNVYHADALANEIKSTIASH